MAGESVIDTAGVRMERLGHARLPAFLAFADRTTLDSLLPLRATRRPAAGQTYLCALYRDQVIGCTSWYEGHRHDYVGLDGTTARSTGVYLCSSEVLPEFRGRGIGGMLYERRLAECGGGGGGAPAVSIEILGRGVPLSVDDEARPGLVWHLAHDFVVVGHSREDDAGPVLLLRRRRPASASARAEVQSVCDTNRAAVSARTSRPSLAHRPSLKSSTSMGPV
ncbi:GNAT family N-acetyltransferase [Streptomyces aurantiacus]|uniref:GNAT family N-acetyltransferase n=1 Tax=Streptomyces aurantiacus TaxID=47760 RepID=UPI0027D7891E|nr:GNAT family N-acetyltransferase [Streptomyces aurantiacus]